MIGLLVSREGQWCHWCWPCWLEGVARKNGGVGGHAMKGGIVGKDHKGRRSKRSSSRSSAAKFKTSVVITVGPSLPIATGWTCVFLSEFVFFPEAFCFPPFEHNVGWCCLCVWWRLRHILDFLKPPMGAWSH